MWCGIEFVFDFFFKGFLIGEVLGTVVKIGSSTVLLVESLVSMPSETISSSSASDVVVYRGGLYTVVLAGNLRSTGSVPS